MITHLSLLTILVPDQEEAQPEAHELKVPDTLNKMFFSHGLVRGGCQ
jgi:hypothetical protein